MLLLIIVFQEGLEDGHPEYHAANYTHMAQRFPYLMNAWVGNVKQIHQPVSENQYNIRYGYDEQFAVSPVTETSSGESPFDLIYINTEVRHWFSATLYIGRGEESRRNESDTVLNVLRAACTALETCVIRAPARWCADPLE
jgi:hypothetical protein